MVGNPMICSRLYKLQLDKVTRISSTVCFPVKNTINPDDRYHLPPFKLFEICCTYP